MHIAHIYRLSFITNKESYYEERSAIMLENVGSVIRVHRLTREIFPYTQVALEWTYLHAYSYSDSLKITKIVELVAG